MIWSVTKLKGNHRAGRAGIPRQASWLQQLLLCEQWVNNEAFSLLLSVPSFRPRTSQFVAFFPPKNIFEASTMLYGNTASTLLLTTVFWDWHRTYFTKPFLQRWRPRLLPTLATTNSKQEASLHLPCGLLQEFPGCLIRRETSVV